MRITILFSSLSGYMVEFFRTLARQERATIQLVHRATTEEAPYEAFDLSFCREAYVDEHLTEDELTRRVHAFDPECLLICSWNYPRYMRVARTMRHAGKYVVAGMDNQWHGTLKQWLGVLAARWFLHSAIDTFLVAGDRQAYFARKLGYKSVMYGYYAADVELFRGQALVQQRQRGFLFAGRLIHKKGVDLLAEAYRLYRRHANEPWDLIVLGTGPLASALRDIEGVVMEGFVQPNQVPEYMKHVGCFVLPSRFEPWGVVIHEAAAAGLAILCTTACGASTYFVRDGVNGYIVPPDIEALAGAMARIAALESVRLQEMGAASRALAGLWTPSMLAKYFFESVESRLRGSGGRHLH